MFGAFSLASLYAIAIAVLCVRRGGTLRRIVDEYEFVPNYLRSKVRPWVWKAKWRLRALGER